jgi:RNA polymerase sigma-70 factor (ECF subfamily)
VQEVFIEAFRSIVRFRSESKLSTWLYRVCVNVALQRLRKRRRRGEVVQGDRIDSSDERTPHRLLEAQERMRAVYRILDRLAPKKRMVFVLHEIEGREPKEIASLVGAPVLTVRTRLHYARKEFYDRASREPALGDLPATRSAKGKTSERDPGRPAATPLRGVQTESRPNPDRVAARRASEAPGTGSGEEER